MALNPAMDGCKVSIYFGNYRTVNETLGTTEDDHVYTFVNTPVSTRALRLIGTISGTIVHFTDAGGGLTNVETTDPHLYITGNYCWISGTTNYNGYWKITKVDADNFTIKTAWIADDATGAYTASEFVVNIDLEPITGRLTLAAHLPVYTTVKSSYYSYADIDGGVNLLTKNFKVNFPKQQSELDIFGQPKYAVHNNYPHTVSYRLVILNELARNLFTEATFNSMYFILIDNNLPGGFGLRAYEGPLWSNEQGSINKGASNLVPFELNVEQFGMFEGNDSVEILQCLDLPGLTQIKTLQPHDLEVDDWVIITGTASYNGFWKVFSTSHPNAYEIATAWIADETGVSNQEDQIRWGLLGDSIMAVHTRPAYAWTIEITPPAGLGTMVEFATGSIHGIRPSMFKLEQRDDVAASRFEIKFPQASRFFAMWDGSNIMAAGAKIVLKVDGIHRFTGWTKEPIRNYNSQDQSITLIAFDRMGMLKDATVEIKKTRGTVRPGAWLLVRKEPGSQIWLATIDPDVPITGSITSVTDPGGGLTNMVSVGHGLSTGDFTKIYFTTNYDGLYSVTKVDDDNFTIPFAFVADDSGLFKAVDRIQLWAENFIIPLWIGEPTIDGERVLLSEYEVLYEIGGIAFKHSTVRTIGDTDADQETLDDVEDSVWADIVYYDVDDVTTKVSTLIKDAFETVESKGGLAWTEDVEFVIEDDTPSDILNEMKWNTNLGDGDCVSFLQNLYDNKDIGLAPSYWIRDFNGDGTVTFRLVEQNNASSIDIDLIHDAKLPTPFGSIYSRAVIVNNKSHKTNLMRADGAYAPIVTDVFPTGDFPELGVKGVNETKDHPQSSAVGVENLYDGATRTSWGYFSIGNKGQYGLDQVLPKDKVLFTLDFGSLKPIEDIYFNCMFTFRGGDESQPILYDNYTKQSAVNGLYMVYENQRITVEYNTTDDPTPDPDGWHILHPDLYMAQVDILDAERSWKMVKGIEVEARHLRVVINIPMFIKVAETNWSNEAFRAMLWFMSEFIVLSQGRVMDSTDEQPEVKFTDDPNSTERCLFDITNNLVDMYRPTLLAFLEAQGLKYKSLILEKDGVWDFNDLTNADPDEVGLGYKYLVSRLDALSKENEWVLRIDPRPDVMIGSTLHSSRLNAALGVTVSYLVHQNTLLMVGPKITQTLIVSDHVNVDGDEPSGFC